jgi:hypothetical protein
MDIVDVDVAFDNDIRLVLERRLFRALNLLQVVKPPYINVII